MIGSLPPAMQRFVEARPSLSSSPSPSSGSGRVTLEQRGTMRLKVDGKWLPFTAEQWMGVDRTEFCWHARVKMAPLVTAVVEDAFEDGHGRLDAKVWGAITVAHAEGPEVDRGEVQRYLAEIPWNPGAVLNNAGLRFEERPVENAYDVVRVWFEADDIYVDLHVAANGDIASTFTTTRHYADQGPTPWRGHFFDYEDVAGVRIPTRGEVAWELGAGEFVYWRGEVTSWRQAD